MLALGRAPRPDEESGWRAFWRGRATSTRPIRRRALELIYKGGKFSPEGVPVNPPPEDWRAMLPKDLPLEAAWTGVARVLLNLDDFLTRD